MSIFIEDTDLIEITINYGTDKDNKVIIINDDPTKTQNDVTDDEYEKIESVKMTFRRPDFSLSQRITSASTSTDSGGIQVMNIMALQNNLIYFLAQSWDVKDEKGEPVELNNTSIGKLKIEIARAFVIRLSEKIGQIL